MSISTTILGSSSATPTPTRHPSAQLVKIQEKQILIDCGEGTQHRLIQFRKSAHKISAIFISHLHGDHFFGLIGLLSSLNLASRSEDLLIFGPAGLDEIISTQLRYSQTHLKFKVLFYHTNPDKAELLHGNNIFQIHSFPLSHRVPTTGFIIREKPKPFSLNPDKITADLPIAARQAMKSGQDYFDSDSQKIYKASEYTMGRAKSYSYAYCSDTAYHEPVLEHIQNVDLLYHEATFEQQHAKRAAETLHSTAKEAALIARKANSKKLLLGHFSARYDNTENLIREAREVFENAELVEEGKEYFCE